MGEFAGKALESFCAGVQVYNAAIAGTTAQQWADGLLDGVDASQCGGTPDYVWLSVGGNDALNTGCSASKSTLVSAIKAAINAVKTKYPSATIVMTGYCMAMSNEECANQGDYTNLAEALQQATDETSVTFVDSISACGGSISSWSTSGYFQDFIHLNNRGYCKVFTQSVVQSGFACGERSYDCDAASCQITGLSQHCGDSSMTDCSLCGAYCTEDSGGSGGSGGSGVLSGSGGSSGEEDCEDDDATAIELTGEPCEALVELCEDEENGATMKEFCPATCRMCSDSGNSSMNGAFSSPLNLISALCLLLSYSVA